MSANENNDDSEEEDFDLYGDLEATVFQRSSDPEHKSVRTRPEVYYALCNALLMLCYLCA